MIARSVILAFVCGVLALGQDSAAPTVTLPADVVRSIQDAIAAAYTPPPVPPVAVTVENSEPSQIVSIGAGAQGLGPAQIFGYFSVSQHIATGTYTTQINEFVRMPGGSVGTSVRAGISKVLWAPGPLTIGVVGDAGVAEGSTGSASGAFSGRGFIIFRFGKTPFGMIATAQTMTVAGSGQQGKFTIGASYSFLK